MHKVLNKKLSVLMAATALIVGGAVATAQDLPVSPSPEGASVYFVSPNDGDTVGTEFTVIFGLKGMGIAPAGIDAKHTGHHHLLVNQESLPEPGKPMGNPPLHFGSGQTETTLTLEPGTHTLQLILGDHLHIPHDPVVASEKITITVK
ncbi:MAG: DUF4399 domain-containing protein [Granulosicoccus sp.]